MNRTHISRVLFGLILMGNVLGAIAYFSRPKPVVKAAVVTIPDNGPFLKASWEAATVYGISCGDQTLANMTARHALRTGLPARVLAALVKAESTCDPKAYSYKGAFGLMMIQLKSHPEVDATHTNIFNPEENMRIGSDILATLVKKHGLRTGIARYFGQGTDGLGLTDGTYADKILRLAGMPGAR